MRTVPLRDAQSHLAELIDSASAGEEIVITRDNRAVAKLVPASAPTSLRDLRPSSVGNVLRPLTPDDDLLDEMTKP